MRDKLSRQLCHLELNGEIEKNNEGSFLYREEKHKAHFMERLFELYKNELLCDVVLCVEGGEIHTHKSVLAANSEYFESK